MTASWATSRPLPRQLGGPAGRGRLLGPFAPWNRKAPIFGAFARLRGRHSNPEYLFQSCPTRVRGVRLIWVFMAWGRHLAYRRPSDLSEFGGPRCPVQSFTRVLRDLERISPQPAYTWMPAGACRPSDSPAEPSRVVVPSRPQCCKVLPATCAPTAGSGTCSIDSRLASASSDAPWRSLGSSSAALLSPRPQVVDVCCPLR